MNQIRTRDYRYLQKIEHHHDSLLSDLQRATDKITKKELNQEQLHQQQNEVNHLFNQINWSIKKNGDQLTHIDAQLRKSRTYEKHDVSREEQLYEHLAEYFKNMHDNAVRLYDISQEKLQQLQKTHLMNKSMCDVSDQTHINRSHRLVVEAVQNTRQLDNSLIYQQSRLENIRAQLGGFVDELNISKTLTKMIASRSKQDQKLIIMLTILLFVEIFACQFYIRPWIKS